MNEHDPDHWAYNMRRCPFIECNGVVDDELETPRCCACGNELHDGPGAMPLPSPSGRVWQKDPYVGHPDQPPTRPTNVVSLDTCPWCGGHPVEVHMGPHRFVVERDGRKAVEQLTYPALHCTACGEGWTDHRAEGVRDEAARRLWKQLGD